MTIAKIILASATAIILSSAAWAEEQTTGQILKIDQANGKITLQHMQGVVNPATGPDEYKMQDGLALNGLKVGDPVTYAAGQIGGVWTVTKIQKR